MFCLLIENYSGLVEDMNVPNKVVINVNNNMEEDPVAQRVQQEQRAIVRATNNGWNVDIQDFTNNPFISFNENNQPYATSIELNFQGNTELTPVQIDGMTMTRQWVNQADLPTPSVIEEDKTLVNWDQFTDVSAGSDITINPGEGVTVAVKSKATATTQEGRETSRFVNIINNASNTAEKVVQLEEDSKVFSHALAAGKKLWGLTTKIFQKKVETPTTESQVKDVCGLPNVNLVDLGADIRGIRGEERYILNSKGLKLYTGRENNMRIDGGDDLDELDSSDDVYTALPDTVFVWRD